MERISQCECTGHIVKTDQQCRCWLIILQKAAHIREKQVNLHLSKKKRNSLITFFTLLKNQLVYLHSSWNWLSFTGLLNKQASPIFLTHEVTLSCDCYVHFYNHFFPLHLVERESKTKLTDSTWNICHLNDSWIKLPIATARARAFKRAISP